MRRTRGAAIMLIPLLFAATEVGAQQLGTAQEAKAMLEKAAGELKKDEKTALIEIKQGKFNDRDLYVFCWDTVTGQWTAHPTLKGDIRALKDKTGVPIGEMLFAAAAKEGWVTTVDFYFPKPGGTETVAKQSFVTKVGNQGCSVGDYKGWGTEPLKSLFPWPPPTPSTQRSYSPDVISGSPPTKTVGEVASRLEKLLTDNAYTFGYYRVPGGFALITRMEKLDTSTGGPLNGSSRWGPPAHYVNVKFEDIFAITRSIGYYRIFAFIVTDDPPFTKPSSETYNYAERWAREGAPALPSEIKNHPIQSKHVLIVMVYEFEKTDGGNTKHVMSSRWSLDEHLRSLSVSLKRMQ